MFVASIIQKSISKSSFLVNLKNQKKIPAKVSAKEIRNSK